MRKPEDQKTAGADRETLWGEIRELKTFTLADLDKPGSGLHARTIAHYLDGLVAAGYVKREQEEGSGERGAGSKQSSSSHLPSGAVSHLPSPFVPFLYTLVRDAVEPPRVRPDGTVVTMGKGRSSMWRTMKILKQFTLTDLTVCSSVPDHAVAAEEARTYLAYLARAGYLRKLDGRPLASASYKLVRWTGPRAPMIQRIKQVYDPNLRKVTWPAEKADGREEKGEESK